MQICAITPVNLTIWSEVFRCACWNKQYDQSEFLVNFILFCFSNSHSPTSYPNLDWGITSQKFLTYHKRKGAKEMKNQITVQSSYLEPLVSWISRQNCQNVVMVQCTFNFYTSWKSSLLHSHSCRSHTMLSMPMPFWLGGEGEKIVWLQPEWLWRTLVLNTIIYHKI